MYFHFCHWGHEGSERLCSLSRITQPSGAWSSAPSAPVPSSSCCFHRAASGCVGQRAQGRHLTGAYFPQTGEGVWALRDKTGWRCPGCPVQLLRTQVSWETQTQIAEETSGGPTSSPRTGLHSGTAWGAGACYPEQPRADCQPRICCDNALIC